MQAANPADPVENQAQPSIAVSLQNVKKRFGDTIALHDVSLDIRDREFFTLLGPSGCGKTTLLRILAGFESVSAGTVYLHGKPIASLPANQRPVNTVFQQYSLFPHMNVSDNILFGLQMRKVPAARARERMKQMLELVQLQDYGDRMPSQLSGGQQQRVALARALAPEPEVLLLDEPLSALDLKLRQAMRVELKQIQEAAGITFIFVTHDQEEALTLSDRIAVMSAGSIQQIGSSQEIYETPANRVVADFIGETNLLEATVLSRDGNDVLCELAGGTRLLAVSTAGESFIRMGSKGHVCVRPERFNLISTGTGTGTGTAFSNQLSGTVERHVYLGTDTQLRVRLDDGLTVQVRSQNSHHASTLPAPGDRVQLMVEVGAARFLGS